MFEQRKGRFEAAAKFLAADRGNLALRIMQVVEVDCFEAEVGAALIDHRGEPFRRHAMRAVNQITRGHDARPHVMIVEPGARIRWHIAVESDVTALGRHYDFFALQRARAD